MPIKLTMQGAIAWHLLLVPLFLALGVWQLQRAEQKREWRAMLEQNLRAQPVQIMALDEARAFSLPNAAGRTVQVTGHFDSNHQYLVDNQIDNGKSGYWVLTPLQLRDRETILVNRGWIAAGQDRTVLPEVAVADTEITVQGRLTRPYRPVLLLPNANPERLAPGRTRLQHVDVVALEQELGPALFPLILELDASSPVGYARHWSLPVINAERHTAYAVQWFALAFLLVMIHWRARRSAQTEHTEAIGMRSP
jgi:surfeit locus 1 family protein